MTYYADIAAIRIQSWLARTPRLKGRRGASILLREATDSNAVAGLLPQNVRINLAAGNVDGVVNLESDDPQALAQSAVAVLRSLRERLPAVELQAAQSKDAADYFTAYSEMKSALAGGRSVEWQPVVPDVPFAQPCDFCGLDPGSFRRDISPDESDRGVLVCRDCAARLDAAGRQADRRRAPDVSVRVRDWLLEAAPPGAELDFPDDFSELAELGRETHLATVYIDGNRIGALFEAIAHSGGRSKKELARGIDDATREALVAGLSAISLGGPTQPDADNGQTPNVVPAIVHLVGGDDVLVSVPAADGWRFTCEFLDVFAASLARWSIRSGLKPQGSPPSASAGLVVHHRNHPFALVVESASEALDHAKSQLKGEQGAVAWVDVSSTGSEVRGPRTASWLAARHETLSALAAVKPAQRSRLSQTPDSELADQIRRMNVTPAGVFLRESPQALRDSLSIVRLWNND
jgi:hypothetical protein